MSERSEPGAPSETREHPLFAALVSRPVALGMLFLTCVLVGSIAYRRIPLQLMPDGLVEPALWISASHPGASAAENEERVARVIEEELRTLTGVSRVRSRSSQDRVGISVGFAADTDMALAKAEVRDRIERARPRLPDTVREIGLWSWNESDLPIMFFGLMHPGDSPRTDFLVDAVIRQRLEAVEGVGQVEVHGLLDDSVRILLDEDRVRAAEIDLGVLIRRLAQDNFAMPLGDIDDGGRTLLLRSDMRFGSLEEIAAYPVGNGLTVGDLAQVLPVKSVRDRLSRLNGSDAYFAEVRRDGQANVVQTCERVRAELAELEKDPRLAGEFGFLVVFDQGRFIEQSLGQLATTALTGGGLAVLVLLIFLARVRLTICVALSIPVSVLLAIAWSYFSGGSFNVLTMSGITLALGMLVDNSVVVTENIIRLRARGLPARQAAIDGTGEVGLAVVLSTLTTVVVFLPMIFMTEQPTLRLIFGELGLPFCISLLFSLLVALVFLPVAVARVLGGRAGKPTALGRAFAAAGALPARLLAWLVGGLRALGRALTRALHVVVRPLLLALTPLRWPLALALLGATLWSAGREALALRPFSELAGAPGAGFVALKGAATTALLHQAPSALAVLVLVLALPWLRDATAGAPGRPGRLVPAGRSLLELVIASNQALVGWTLRHRVLASVLAFLGLASIFVPATNMRVAAFGQDESSNRVRLYVDLEDNFTLAQAADEFQRYEEALLQRKDELEFANLASRFDENGGRIDLYWDGRRSPEQRDAAIADLRRSLPRHPGHRLSFVGDEEEARTNRSVIAFELRGPDSEELAALGARAVELLERVPGLTSVSSPLEDEPEQVEVMLQPEVAQTFGVTAQIALDNIGWALRGVQLPRYQQEDRELPLIIEYDDEEAAGLDTLRELELFGGQGTVPLTSVARLEFGRGSRSILRVDGRVTFTIQGRVADPSRAREVTEAGLLALGELDLPRGYEIASGEGAGRGEDEEVGELKSAMWLSLVLVFLLLCILFEHLLLGMAVLFTVPFAVVGAFWALYLSGTTMDSVGWIGIIILIGVVVNNGIVLVHRVHVLRGEGLERSAAVLEGCANRVRPILMTALTTVIGLVPMAISQPPSEGIDYRALATCVAGGLATSTFFTLWVVPLGYTVIDDLWSALRRALGWGVRRPTAEREPPPAPVRSLASDLGAG